MLNTVFIKIPPLLRGGRVLLLFYNGSRGTTIETNSAVLTFFGFNAVCFTLDNSFVRAGLYTGPAGKAIIGNTIAHLKNLHFYKLFYKLLKDLLEAPNRSVLSG